MIAYEKYETIGENMPYDLALKEVMIDTTDWQVGMRRMDGKHKSPKAHVPDTRFLTKQDGILWRSTAGGGRAGRVGKGKQQLWFTFQLTKSKTKAKAKAEIKPKIKKRKKAIPKSQLKKDALFE